MSNFSISEADFSATTVTVTAETAEAKSLMADTFGPGAVAAELPKSQLQRFADYVESKGVKF